MPNVVFTLDDYIRSFEKLRKPTVWGGIVRELGHAGGKRSGLEADQFEAELARGINRVLGIFCSMTIAERNDRTILFESRLRRIARGAGVTVEDVRMILKQFEALSAFASRPHGRPKRA